MRNIYLYAHGGSGNHGCEAIVRSTIKLLKDLPGERLLITSNPEEDMRYGIEGICRLVKDTANWPKVSIEFVKAYFALKIHKDYIPMDALKYQRAVNLVQKEDIALSIGGDNYCYADVERYIMLHNMFRKRGAKTVLWGCSVEPELLKNKVIADDLASYDMITARESISYKALKEINPNTFFVSDTAFKLESKYKQLPDGFEVDQYIGINVSPMVIARENKTGIVMKNYMALIRYILETTNLKIMLIPHVIWADGDDRIPLHELCDVFSDTGRVVLIEDCNCEELKGYIARCKFFVGARTHATIAAYSSGVPTLVVGYSVKARGIARDLFGTEEGYTLPVQAMEEETDLVQAFSHIQENEEIIRKRLNDFLPQYIDNQNCVEELRGL